MFCNFKAFSAAAAFSQRALTVGFQRIFSKEQNSAGMSSAQQAEKPQEKMGNY